MLILVKTLSWSEFLEDNAAVFSAAFLESLRRQVEHGFSFMLKTTDGDVVEVSLDGEPCDISSIYPLEVCTPPKPVLPSMDERMEMALKELDDVIEAGLREIGEWS